MKKLIKILFLLQFSFFISKAQHPYFSSLNQQLLSTNPAFAGSNDKLRLQSQYANCYPNTTSQQVLYYLGADMLVGKHHGLGINAHAMNFSKGTFKQSQVSISYAYHFVINNKIKIVPAFQASYFQYKEDLSKIFSPGVFGILPPSPTKNNMDYSAGLMIYEKNYYGGVSVLSLTQPDQGLLSVSKRPITQIYQGGYRFEISEITSVNAYGFIMVQNNHSVIQLGTYLGYNNFKLHLAYKTSDQFITGFNYTIKGFRAGYNLTTGTNNLAGNTSYIHEVYVSMNFGSAKKEGEEKRDGTVKLID